MISRRAVAALVWGLVAATAQAAGVREVVIPADQSGPAISARLWTPCAKRAGPITVDSGNDRLTIQAVKDCAAPAKTGLPLIVISHGLWGDVFDHHDTAEVLADAGFAVVSFNHTLDSLGASKESIGDIASLLVRPKDVRRVIDFFLGHSPKLLDIDSPRIGFFGYSRGGYTGLMLAGAVPNFSAPPFPCPDDLVMCKQMRNNEIPEHPSGQDARIKAFVLADPVSLFPDKDSLKGVTAPIQLWSSEQGGMGVRPQDVAALAKNLPKPPEWHRPTQSAHFAFLFPCSDEVRKARAFVCIDPPGFDRTAFHKQFNALVLRFFRKTLLSQPQ